MKVEILESIIKMFEVAGDKENRRDLHCVKLEDESGVLRLTATNGHIATVRHILDAGDVLPEKPCFVMRSNLGHLKELFKVHKKAGEFPLPEFLNYTTEQNDSYPSKEVIDGFFGDKFVYEVGIDIDLMVKVAKSLNQGLKKQKHVLRFQFNESNKAAMLVGNDNGKAIIMPVKLKE